VSSNSDEEILLTFTIKKKLLYYGDICEDIFYDVVSIYNQSKVTKLILLISWITSLIRACDLSC